MPRTKKPKKVTTRRITIEIELTIEDLTQRKLALAVNSIARGVYEHTPSGPIDNDDCWAGGPTCINRYRSSITVHPAVITDGIPPYPFSDPEFP